MVDEVQLLKKKKLHLSAAAMAAASSSGYHHQIMLSPLQQQKPKEKHEDVGAIVNLDLQLGLSTTTTKTSDEDIINPLPLVVQQQQQRGVKHFNNSSSSDDHTRRRRRKSNNNNIFLNSNNNNGDDDDTTAAAVRNKLQLLGTVISPGVSHGSVTAAPATATTQDLDPPPHNPNSTTTLTHPDSMHIIISNPEPPLSTTRGRPLEDLRSSSRRSPLPPIRGEGENNNKLLFVGWPPIKNYRRTTITSPPTSLPTSTASAGGTPPNHIHDSAAEAVRVHNNNNINYTTIVHPATPVATAAAYVKVNMDGNPIGRKIDVSAYASYQHLSAALHTMFNSNSPASAAGRNVHFLESSSDFRLTYEDKDSDWMLVGDVPWEMFVRSVRRLKIIRRIASSD